jgi:lysophospholipase L1-like esterase
MNGTRIALVGLVAACAWAAWPKREVVIDTQRISRQLVVWRTLARLDDPIVILGDSIVEASTLPRSLCGHPIVNAGIGGATTASNLGSFLADALGNKQAALVVVSLGGNDAAMSDSVERYRSAYRALLTELKALTPRRAMVGISPVEAGLEDGKKISGAVIDSLNAILPELAKETGATFIPMPVMPEHHTLDGIHLDAAGYAIWDKALLGGIESAVCKSF